MTETSPDLLYGIAAIAAHLGMTARQAKHRAASGGVPTFKMGHYVCASRKKLDEWFQSQMPGLTSVDGSASQELSSRLPAAL